jgi:hypothetical protein
MDNGWVKAHRKLIEWEWYDDSKIVHLYLHCLLKANHKPKKWRGISIESGQFISSIGKLSEQLPLSQRQIRTALDKLKSTGELTIKTTNKYSMISITNWSDYQLDDKQPDKQVTNECQSNDNQMTTNKNDKNDKNKEKKGVKRFTPPSLDELKAYILEKQYDIDGEYFINFYESKGWMIGKNKMKDWKATVRGWQARNKKEANNNGQNRKLTQCEQLTENDRVANEWLESQGITQDTDGSVVERVINPIR